MARDPTRAPTGRSRRCAWCSSVSRIARSACWSARGEASGASASGCPSAATRKSCASWSSGKALASQAAHTTPPAAPEKPTRCSLLAARRAGGELRREAGGQQQLEAEGERVGAGGAGGLAVEQRELVGEQVVDAGVRVAVVEHARHGLAGAGGAVERAGVLAQARVGGDRLGAGDGQQLAAALVEHEVEPEERLQPAAEARARAAHALGDRADSAAIRGIEVQDAVGLSVAEAAEDDALRSLRNRPRYTL